MVGGGEKGKERVAAYLTLIKTTSAVGKGWVRERKREGGGESKNVISSTVKFA